jgi:hypothetical protein
MLELGTLAALVVDQPDEHARVRVRSSSRTRTLNAGIMISTNPVRRPKKL